MIALKIYEILKQIFFDGPQQIDTLFLYLAINSLDFCDCSSVKPVFFQFIFPLMDLSHKPYVLKYQIIDLLLTRNIQNLLKVIDINIVCLRELKYFGSFIGQSNRS